MRKGATLSEDGVYRYLLWREWGGGGTCCFVMLNPSTADAEQDDPTVRRCVGFARSWGYGRLEVVNLFGLRSRSPLALLAHEDPVGPENDAAVAASVERSQQTVVAWGALLGQRIARLRPPPAPQPPGRPPNDTLRWLTGRGAWCLGKTADGSPRHPLYVPKDAQLVRWP